MDFKVKDSGKRQEFDSGMKRDITDGKIDWTLAFDGPMLERYAIHLTKGAQKYEKRNWMKANSAPELHRALESAARHFMQWFKGDTDEDHAAAVIFNLNAAERLRDLLRDRPANEGVAVAPKKKENPDAIIVELDGGHWFARRGDFVNLQESPAGFGKTPALAIEFLIHGERVCGRGVSASKPGTYWITQDNKYFYARHRDLEYPRGQGLTPQAAIDNLNLQTVDRRG